eukprot:6169484-Pyramimonas_sp.AAC.1
MGELVLRAAPADAPWAHGVCLSVCLRLADLRDRDQCEAGRPPLRLARPRGRRHRGRRHGAGGAPAADEL